MTDFLKGNFDVKRPPTAAKTDHDLTERFEREALAKLGGSIAFVSRKKFLYGAPPAPSNATAHRPPGGKSSGPDSK